MKAARYPKADNIVRRKDPYEMGPKCHTKREGNKKVLARPEKDPCKNGRRSIQNRNETGKNKEAGRIARAKVHTKVERYGKGSGSGPHGIPPGTAAGEDPYKIGPKRHTKREGNQNAAGYAPKIATKMG